MGQDDIANVVGRRPKTVNPTARTPSQTDRLGLNVQLNQHEIARSVHYIADLNGYSPTSMSFKVKTGNNEDV